MQCRTPQTEPSTAVAACRTRLLSLPDPPRRHGRGAQALRQLHRLLLSRWLMPPLQPPALQPLLGFPHRPRQRWSAVPEACVCSGRGRRKTCDGRADAPLDVQPASEMSGFSEIARVFTTSHSRCRNEASVRKTHLNGISLGLDGFAALDGLLQLRLRSACSVGLIRGLGCD